MKYIFVVLLLAGCTTSNYTLVEMQNVRIDNTAKNNFVGNPCEFYINDYCILMKPKSPTNPNNPYDRRRSD